MKMSRPMIDELTREAETTRRVLERVPEDKLAWKPHSKSMSLGQLALHVAQTPGAVAQLITEDECEVPQFTQPEATSGAELLAALGADLAGQALGAHQVDGGGHQERLDPHVEQARHGGRGVVGVERRQH